MTCVHIKVEEIQLQKINEALTRYNGKSERDGFLHLKKESLKRSKIVIQIIHIYRYV